MRLLQKEWELMEIFFAEEETIKAEILDTMERAAIICAEMEGLDPDACEVSVSFVSEEEIRTLNRDYRGIDSVTDVLSFPQFEDVEDMKGESIALGDVVICDAKAHSQAEEYGHSYEREIIYLFVHSVLHLLGYDHMEPEEKAEMRAREEEVMDRLGIPRS